MADENAIQGISAGAGFDAHTGGVTPTTPDKVAAKAKSLQELSEDYVFFSHAPIMTWGDVPFDPVNEYMRIKGADAHDIGSMVFSDVLIYNACCGRSKYRQYSYTLFFVAREHWDELKEFISTLGVSDAKRKLLVRPFVAETEVVDHLRLSQPGVANAVTYVPLTVFSVDSNRFLLQVQPGDQTGVTHSYASMAPRLSRKPPRDETVAFAKQFFQET